MNLSKCYQLCFIKKSSKNKEFKFLLKKFLNVNNNFKVPPVIQKYFFLD